MLRKIILTVGGCLFLSGITMVLGKLYAPGIGLTVWGIISM